MEIISEFVNKMAPVKVPVVSALCSLLIMLGLYSGYSSLSSLKLPAAHVVTAASQPTLPKKTVEIAKLHLYGDSDNNLNQLPESTLQLTLEGVISSSVNANSRAIIRSKGKQAKIYKVGQMVPGGAVIKVIQHNQVILSYNNELESLKLPVPKLNN